MNLLLIEDDRRVADFIERGLKAEGFTVTIASNGLDGLNMGQDGGFDAIVLDLMLPKMHGHQVCEQLRHSGVRTPILILTATDEPEDRGKGLELGADDYLSKPFAFDEFLDRLHTLAHRPGNDHEPIERIGRGFRLVRQADPMAPAQDAPTGGTMSSEATTRPSDQAAAQPSSRPPLR